MSEQPKYSKGEELMSELSAKFEKAEKPNKAIAVAEAAENEAILNVLKKKKIGDPEFIPQEEKDAAIALSVSIFKTCDDKNLIKTELEAEKLFEEFHSLRDDFIGKLHEEIVKSAFTSRQAALEKLWQYLTEKF